MRNRVRITRRTRGEVARYREWLIEHPEMLAVIIEELKTADTSKYSVGTLKRMKVVQELQAAQKKVLP